MTPIIFANSAWQQHMCALLPVEGADNLDAYERGHRNQYICPGGLWRLRRNL